MSSGRTGVLAVLVTAGNTPYLRRTLVALARQEVPASAVLVVDVASRRNGLGDGTPVEDVVELSGIDAVSRARILHVSEAFSFGDAVRRGLLALQEDGRLPAPSHPYLWLLHDDSAPAPGCLASLLNAVTSARSVALAGPKQVDWDNPEQLLEVGLRTTASARRANDIVPGEIDQGQHDGRSDVLAVGTAGALVDRAVFDEIGGISPAFGAFGDGSDPIDPNANIVFTVVDQYGHGRRCLYQEKDAIQTDVAKYTSPKGVLAFTMPPGYPLTIIFMCGGDSEDQDVEATLVAPETGRAETTVVISDPGASPSNGSIMH